jgi:hypothetical protein
MTKELDFSLKLRHYDDDYGGTPLARLKPRGRELLERIRHNAAQVSRSAIYLDVRPSRRAIGGPTEELATELADAAKAMLEDEIYDPLKRYQQIRDKVALGALAARMWWAAVEFDPDLGPSGELVWRLGDGRLLMWTVGFESPHDLRCPCVIEVLPRMPLDDIKRMKGWKNQDLVKPDDGWKLHPQNSSTTDSAASLAATTGYPEPDGAGYGQTALIVKLWERGRYETTKRENIKEPLLKPADRYMVCSQAAGGGCGFRTPPQSDSGSGAYPEAVPGACPDCGGDLMRVDAEAVTQELLAYRRGRSLTIFSPLSRVELYNGEWPYESSRGGMRTVPYIVVQFFEHPSPDEPIGQSMTSEHKSMQLASDMTLRLGLEQMVLAKPYIVHPPNATAYDYLGEPWEGRPEQGLSIFMKGEYGQSLSLLQSSGLPVAWGTLHQALQNVFRSATGSADLSIAPSATKDIPVGTLQILEQSGEIPVEHLIEKFRREEGIGFSVAFDIKRATGIRESGVRMQGDEGRWRVTLLRAADLPDMDITVTADPSLKKLDMDHFQALMQFASAPPAMREFAGRALGIPKSEIARLEELEAQGGGGMPGQALGPEQAPGAAPPLPMAAGF